MFLVDLSSLDDPEDIKSDDCGHWVHTTIVAVTSQSGEVTDVKRI